jgi:hypothetical protein
MKWLVYLLLAVEAGLVGCALSRALSHAVGGDLTALLLAANSLLLIWSATRWRRIPSCCR